MAGHEVRFQENANTFGPLPLPPPRELETHTHTHTHLEDRRRIHDRGDVRVPKARPLDGFQGSRTPTRRKIRGIDHQASVRPSRNAFLHLAGKLQLESRNSRNPRSNKTEGGRGGRGSVSSPLPERQIVIRDHAAIRAAHRFLAQIPRRKSDRGWHGGGGGGGRKGQGHGRTPRA